MLDKSSKQKHVLSGLAALILAGVVSSASVSASSTMEHGSSEHDHSSHDHGDDHSGHSMDGGSMSVDVSTEKGSTWGTFVVRLDHGVDTLPLNKMHQCVIEILDKEGNPVEGAQIRVDGGMPAHGHGLPTKPRVTKSLGGGKYLVEGLKFSMHGMWQLVFDIRTASQEDSVIFNFEV